MFFKYRMYNNPKLAEELMFGSSDDKVVEINEKLWKKFDGDRALYYVFIAKLCGKPITARARYVIAMAYSWNRVDYCRKAIKYLELYLSKPLYKEMCVSNGIYSTKERTNFHLSDMYCYLGDAYKHEEFYNKAKDSFQKAIQYSPNCIRGYLKLAELYVCQKDYKSAIELLENARDSKYAKYDNEPKKFAEIYIRKESVEERLKEYKQRLYIETTYPYKQKQVRELVMNELKKQNLNINLTQPKLKLICEQFNLKSREDLFHQYPESDIYRCSRKLVDILVNSLVNNPNLIDEIKELNKK